MASITWFGERVELIEYTSRPTVGLVAVIRTARGVRIAPAYDLQVTAC